MTAAGSPVPAEVIARLATGGGGPQACAHLVAGQYGKHALLLLTLVRAAEERGHPDAGLARDAYDLLAAIEEGAPGAVRAVVRHPAVGAWAAGVVRVLTGPGPAGGADLRWFATLAAAAAIRSGGTHTVDVPAPAGTVVLPSLGVARLTDAPDGADRPDATAEVHCAAGLAEVRAAGRRVLVSAEPGVELPGWRPLPRIVTAAAGLTLSLTIDDCDPNRMPAATNLGAMLSPVEIAWWGSAVQSAWTVLALRHRPVAEEVAVALRVLTPLAAPATGQVSASSPDTTGTVAMSVPPDARTFALTLAHEVQHAKLAALLDLVPLTRPDDGRRFYAPWREDPRPVRALLHGSYAHLGMAGFWRRHRRQEQGQAATRAYTEFARWRAATHAAVDLLLGTGQLTAAGDAFVTGMERTLSAWAEDPVPEAARAVAQRITEEHLQRWRARNGGLPRARPDRLA